MTNTTTTGTDDPSDLVDAVFQGQEPAAPSGDASRFAEPVSAIAKRVCERVLADGSRLGFGGTDPLRAANELLGEINAAIDAQNQLVRDGVLRGRRLLPLTGLGHATVARLLAAHHHVVAVKPTGVDHDGDNLPLAVYDGDPTSPHYGTYVVERTRLRALARRYSPDLTTKEFAEVEAVLYDVVARVERKQNRDLVACNNCIVDYNSGHPQRIEFSPEHVFLSKLDVNWNPAAQNETLTNPSHCQHVDPAECDLRCTCCERHLDAADCGPACQTWDVESWMSTLSDDPEVVHLLWQILGAVCRPYVSWGKAAFLLSEVGNNGKGTYLSLARGLAGRYASIPLADFGKPFALEALPRAGAILVDENDVGGYVDQAAAFKAVVTNDVLGVNRKGKPIITHQHFGFMIQCVNERPSFKDKSNSLYRRQLIIPFTKCFTGAERKYIKDDFLGRREVLEYVLKRVLTMKYYELDEPETVRAALEVFKDGNDPVRTFWHEIANTLVWDLVPTQFLYDLFKAWMERNQPNSRPVGRTKFLEQLYALVRADPTSQWSVQDNPHRPKNMMAAPEPLIVEFDLTHWLNSKAAKNAPVDQRARPSELKASYRGLLRATPPVLVAEDEAADAEAAEIIQATQPTTVAPIRVPSYPLDAENSVPIQLVDINRSRGRRAQAATTSKDEAAR